MLRIIRPTPRPVLLVELFLVICSIVVCIVVIYLYPDSEQDIPKERVQSSALENGKDSELLPPCDDDWIWYRNKCYFFSKAQEEWIVAKDSCAAQHSSLALFDTQQELDFMLHNKGDSDQWIGLKRRNPDEPWIWVNGTEFNNWFTVEDYSECASLSHYSVRSSECHFKHKWICTKIPI